MSCSQTLKSAAKSLGKGSPFSGSGCLSKLCPLDGLQMKGLLVASIPGSEHAPRLFEASLAGVLRESWAPLSPPSLGVLFWLLEAAFRVSSGTAYDCIESVMVY